MAISNQGNALKLSLLYRQSCVMVTELFRIVTQGHVMFRCHFTKDGRIVQGENLDVNTLERAIAEGQRLLAEKTPADDMDGFEIWQCAQLLHSSPLR